MSRKPYVGVTGFMFREEVASSLAAFVRAFPASDRLLMVGVLASSKTLAGEPNKHPLRYPPIADLASVFVEHPRALNLVHYASSKPPDLATLNRLFGAAGERCDGVQFNGAWPEPDDLRRAMWGSWCPPRVVLQARDIDHPADISHRFVPYRGLATDVLLDGSGGRGVSMDLLAMWRAVEHLQGLHFGIGIAGGLCASEIGRVAPLLRDAPWVSIDAEGRLRDDTDGGGRLVFEKVDSYLAEAVLALGVAS